MKSSFNKYDDSDDDSASDLESNFEYPKLLVDEKGWKKFILNKTDESIFHSRGSDFGLTGDVRPPKVNTPANHFGIFSIKEKRTNQGENSLKPASTKKGRTHGLAPFCMTVPSFGNSYVVGRGNLGNIPLLESGLETYNRIQEAKIKKEVKDNKRSIQYLKKAGTVCTLAPFMFDTDRTCKKRKKKVQRY